jgi:hypothetical protein
MDLKKIMINMGLLALFVFGIMFFILTTQTDNEVSVPITNNSLINETYSDLSDSLENSQSQTQDYVDNFGKNTPTEQYGELEVKSIVSPTRTIKTMVIGFWNIMIKLPQAILGVSPAVSYIINAIIGMLIIIGIWAIWKGVTS